MAIDLDAASSEYITCGSGATIDDIFDGGGSVAFWLKINTLPADGADMNILGQRDSGATVGWDCWINNAGGAGARDNVFGFRHRFSSGGAVWESPDEQFTGQTGIWFHIVVTYNADATANNPIIYINGSSISVTEFTSPTGTRSSGAAQNFEMGYSGANSWDPDVMLEDMRLFTRILTAEEVAILAAGNRGPLGGEVGWWDLDRPAAQTLATTDLLPDLSGNSNTGTPTNSPIGRYDPDIKRIRPLLYGGRRLRWRHRDVARISGPALGRWWDRDF